jgi:hypothetical protein
MTQCSVLEHLEKTSTGHFNFAEHEREHRVPNFARAPSTLIIGDKTIYFYLILYSAMQNNTHA